MVRPKTNKPQISPSDRVKSSLRQLREAGGKRLSLRLLPDAVQAVKIIMKDGGFELESKAINAVLIKESTLIKRKYAEEVLALALAADNDYGGRNWTNPICGGLTELCEAKTLQGFVGVALSYAVRIPSMVEDFKELYPSEIMEEEGRPEANWLVDIEQYAWRASNCDMNYLRELAAAKFSELQENNEV